MLAYELTVIHVTHSETYLFGKPEEIFIERSVEGKPHSGKVLAVIAPHADDFTIFCGGTVAKLVREGYTAYFIGRSKTPTTTIFQKLYSATPQTIGRRLRSSG